MLLRWLPPILHTYQELHNPAHKHYQARPDNTIDKSVFPLPDATLLHQPRERGILNFHKQPHIFQ